MGFMPKAEKVKVSPEAAHKSLSGYNDTTMLSKEI